MHAAVTQDLLLKVLFQGVNSLFKKQEDILFLVRQVLEALIILRTRCGDGTGGRKRTVVLLKGKATAEWRALQSPGQPPRPSKSPCWGESAVQWPH